MTHTTGHNLIHASAVAFGKWCVLLRGPSGAGKSDLALRLIEAGGMLVGDDQLILNKRDSLITAQPQERLTGLLEVRGVGLINSPCAGEVAVALILNLVDKTQIERMPDARVEDILGVELPVLDLYAFEPSAAAKVKVALKTLLD